LLGLTCLDSEKKKKFRKCLCSPESRRLFVSTTTQNNNTMNYANMSTPDLKALLPFTTCMSPSLQKMAEEALKELSRREVVVTRFDFRERN
jgi:hypothetical protein